MYDTYLGRLGNPEGINVARVEVSWFHDDPGLGHVTKTESGTGYYIVHATGDEPECEGEEGTIYNVFEGLVHAAMEAKIDNGRIDGYQIEDISSV